MKPGDKELVVKLSGARNTVLHGEDDSPDLSQELVNQLRYLVERLVVGVSIGGYEDLEDSTHKFHIGTIGPGGGAAPITVGGADAITRSRTSRLRAANVGRVRGGYIGDAHALVVVCRNLRELIEAIVPTSVTAAVSAPVRLIVRRCKPTSDRSYRAKSIEPDELTRSAPSTHSLHLPQGLSLRETQFISAHWLRQVGDG